MMRIDSEPMTIPVIALRGLTVFPNVLIHFEVTRETSVRALEAAMSEGTPTSRARCRRSHPLPPGEAPGWRP